MKILFLHGWHSVVGGVKPTHLANAGHVVLNPSLDDDDFDQALKTAQQVFDSEQPDVVVGSSRGGALAMNLDSGMTPLVLLCPAWKRWGNRQSLKPQAVVLHSRDDEVIPFVESLELIERSGLSLDTLIETGSDHRLADPESLEMMRRMCEQLTGSAVLQASTSADEIPLELIIELFSAVERKGPGSDASTLQALSLVDSLPNEPHVVEFGCGSGIATLLLARTLNARVTAIDFCPSFLEQLAECASRNGLSDRIEVVHGDMANPELEPRSVDLIWSEAAIYNVGFRKGLELWKPLLRPGGWIAVSEVVWLDDSPPPEARAFWESEYPAIATINSNLELLVELGYESVSYFVLPESDWAGYYKPLEKRLHQFVAERPDSSMVQALTESIKREIDLWRRFGTSFGYCFFVGCAKAD